MIRTTRGRVVVDRKALAAWLREPDGEIMRDLDRRMVTVQVIARNLVRRRTGLLYSTIRKNRNPKRLWVDVLAGQTGKTPYLGYEMDGTPPHIIRAKMRGRGKKRRAGYLRFMIGGRVTFRRSVKHPGTKGTGFLVRALPYARY
jgi:hypothetical protein